jgi:DEAD/DEAH box helicase
VDVVRCRVAVREYEVSHAFILVLVLVPTRELALQTSQVCKELGRHMNVQVMVSTGGTSLKDDIVRLYNMVHILVATPGRVLDLANKKVADLSHCQTMIMDEVFISIHSPFTITYYPVYVPLIHIYLCIPLLHSYNYTLHSLIIRCIPNYTSILLILLHFPCPHSVPN